MQFLIRVFWLIKYKLARLNARASVNNRLKRIRQPSKILVLCYGNIYRSPLVGYYLTKKIPQIFGDIEVKSAGFHQKSGRKSHQDYIHLVGNYCDIDLNAHVSATVNSSLLDWADMVIIMDGQNYKNTLVMNPKVENKLIWLGACCGNNEVEIKDPYDTSEEKKKEIIKQLIDSCDCLLSRINAN